MKKNRIIMHTKKEKILKKYHAEDYVKSKVWKFDAQEALPFLPTPFEAIKATFNYLESHQEIENIHTMCDLGAGDGRLIIYAAKNYGIDSTGLEINTELINSTKKKIKKLHLSKLCRIFEADFYNFDISHMNLLIFFSIPTDHPYIHHLIKNIKSGAIVVSVRWPMDTFSDYWNSKIVLHPVLDFNIFIYKKA